MLAARPRLIDPTPETIVRSGRLRDEDLLQNGLQNIMPSKDNQMRLIHWFQTQNTFYFAYNTMRGLTKICGEYFSGTSNDTPAMEGNPLAVYIFTIQKPTFARIFRGSVI